MDKSERKAARIARFVLGAVVIGMTLVVATDLFLRAERVAKGAAAQLFVPVWWQFPAFGHLVAIISITLVVGTLVVLRRPFTSTPAVVEALLFCSSALATLYVLNRSFHAWVLGATPAF